MSGKPISGKTKMARRITTLLALGGFFVTAGVALKAKDALGPIGGKVVRRAEVILGLEFTSAERKLMLQDLADLRENYQKIRGVSVPNEVPPAILFRPLVPGGSPDTPEARSTRSVVQPPPVPSNLEELAFLPVTDLAKLIETRQITSTALTRMYLARIKRLDPQLKAVVTLTEDLALEQAARADREIESGRYRGPLHGIPWGAKDLLSAKGYPTTWGATPFKEQVIDRDATVVKRLEEAGAVLVAKLALGALAWGDVWFDGMTRNPWNLEQGSSGSSAGPGSATAAGLVGFSIGSETWGSIVSPSTRCGVTGLRPTFGRVSRHGAMALAWTMDKLGPMCRTVEDCALVFEAIYGPDGLDESVVNLPFAWNARLDTGKLRVGYLKSLFEEPIEEGEEADAEAIAAAREWREKDLATLEKLRELGFELIPIELPALPVEALSIILSAEAGAAFDELTRSGQDDLLVRQMANAWPNVFRQSRFIPAVEYIQANRIRTLVMREMGEILSEIDVYVAPSFGGNNLLLNNLTGHPAVVLPNGFRKDGTPTSITFVGRNFGEDKLLAMAKAYQDATPFHRRHPELE